MKTSPLTKGIYFALAAVIGGIAFSSLPPLRVNAAPSGVVEEYKVVYVDSRSQMESADAAERALNQYAQQGWKLRALGGTSGQILFLAK